MNNEQWQIIEGDDHVIFFEDRTKIVTIGQVRQNTESSISNILKKILSNGLTRIPLVNGISIAIIFENLIAKSLSNNEGIKDCELLFLGSSNWQKGKLKISFFLRENFFEESSYLQNYDTKVVLEFLPETIEPTPIDPETSLDDIRQEIYQ